MKKYIAPAVEVEILAAEEMIALSINNNPASSGTGVLVNEEKTATSTQNVWEKEW